MSRLDDFLAVYQKLDADSLDLLGQVYSDQIRFCDPAHEITGLPALKDYFAELYRHVTAISFSFNRRHLLDSEAYIGWTMTVSHPRLAGGQPVAVDGMSYLQFDEHGKVLYHHDYFDLGALLYEQLPLLGSIIKTIKRRFGR
jgi:hypothetical protein